MTATPHDPHVPGDLTELQKLLEEYDVALLTTHGEDGHYHSRPMALQKKGLSTHELWFATYDDSQKVHDLVSDPTCAICLYSEKDVASYVSLSGRAELVRDRRRIYELWEPSWKPWFPQGPDEPDIVLIRFVPEHAEYRHPKTGRLQMLFSMAKSVVTGHREEPAPRKELDLTH